MTAATLTKHYAELSGEERFRLILAADGRGDTVEQERLAKSGKMIALKTPDHSPAAFAFRELALLTFIEISDHASVFQTMVLTMDPASPSTETAPDISDEELEKLADSDDAWDRLIPGRKQLDQVLAAGRIMRKKYQSWMRFCRRLSVPPDSYWQDLPGFERIQRLLSMARSLSFTPKGFEHWAKRQNPNGAAIVTVKQLAKALMQTYRERVVWWGGDRPGDGQDTTTKS